MSIWSKAKAAVRKVFGRERVERDVPKPPPPPGPPKKRPPRTIDAIVDDLYDIGVATSGSHSVTSIHELTVAVSRSNARQLLARQLESTQAWVRGNVEPGRTRWFDRGEWMRDHADGPINFDYDVFFWYHARRKQ